MPLVFYISCNPVVVSLNGSETNTVCWISLLTTTLQFFDAGDNVIVGSKDGKLCWFDTDLSTKPYKMLKYDFSYLD